MNGKQAKRLRRAATGLGVTLTEAGKSIKKDGYVVRNHAPQSASSISVPHLRGDPIAQDPVPIYQLLVRKDSVKGIYKQLKRGKV